MDEYVWHYEDQTLFTLNSEIYRLLKEISVENRTISFSDHLLKDIETHSVIEAQQKVEYFFKFLNRCHIGEICAVNDYQQISKKNKAINFSHRHIFDFKEPEDGVSKKIWLIGNQPCDCISCNYRTLDFNKLLNKLKVADGNIDCCTFEYAYGNYLTATNNFKTTYNIYKTLEKEFKGKSGKGVEYFLVKRNLKLLHNLLLDYSLADSKEVISDINSIDLDWVIHDEIEFDIDYDVRKYLIDVKEDAFISKLQNEIDQTLDKIYKLKKLYDGGGGQMHGPYLPDTLYNQYFLLYLHVNRNYIIYDVYREYRQLAEKVFRGLVISYSLPERGVKVFKSFFLLEAILHVSGEDLNTILKEINTLEVEDGCIPELLEKLNNLTSAQYKDGFFSDAYKNSLVTEQLNNYRFRDKLSSTFANFFIIINKLNITQEQFNINSKSLVKFLKVEDFLYWSNLESLANFIRNKGNLFPIETLIEILKLSVDRDRYGYNKYTKLLESIPKAIAKFYPDYKIDNQKMLQKAIINCSSDNGTNESYTPLIYWSNICDEKCKELLHNKLYEHLDKNFDYSFYEKVIWNSDFNYDSKNFFLQYATSINSSRSDRTYKYGKQGLTYITFINFINLIYKLNVDFKRDELKVFTNTNKFEAWLLNPFEFDYSDFEPLWLIDIQKSFVLDRLKGHSVISELIEQQLKKEFDPALAEIKYAYFN